MYFIIGLLVNNSKRYKIITHIISVIPKRIGYFLCNIVSYLVVLFMKITRRNINIDRNLQEDIDDVWKEFKLVKYIKHLVYMFYELIISQNKPADCVVDGEDYVNRSLQKGKGCILLSAHVGNFFSFGMYVSKKYDCLVVVTGGSKELNPLYIYYKEMNYNMIDYDNTSPIELIKTIKKQLNKNGVVILMGDFYRSNFKDSFLFGMKTKSPYGTAYLSIKNQVDVIPCFSSRNSKKEMVITFFEPIELYKLFPDDKKMLATNYLNGYIERMILADVNQWYYWFDINNRFV